GKVVLYQLSHVRVRTATIPRPTAAAEVTYRE
ncbi:MAG: hypothetical protein QOE17_557, partial [Gaiellales bacterium]|nr:hypothetical protein [Gaiellales bacterium]